MGRRGFPRELNGHALSLSARISHIAETAEVLQRTAGIDEMVDVVRSRSGTHFDPELVDALLTDPASLFDGIDDDIVDEVLDLEPVERPALSDDELDYALAAMGDFCDLRCPYFAGHARGTVDLVSSAATLLQMSPEEARLARRAAFVHDIGRMGVPVSVWDKPGPLTATDRERMRMHVYYVERIFQRPEPLRRVGLLAATHHERMDGSGYHRGVGGHMISASARILAAADAYHAMTQPRPLRGAMTGGEAALEPHRAHLHQAGRVEPSGRCHARHAARTHGGPDAKRPLLSRGLAVGEGGLELSLKGCWRVSLSPCRTV